ncbi:MAG: hypothetical protein ACP5GX_06300 [Anaerolineae bacterium]
MSRKRRILTLLFLLTGIANLIRGVLAFRVLSALEGWTLALPLPFLGTFYLLWGILLTGMAFLFEHSRALGLAFPLAVAYQGFLWILRLTYRSGYARSLWLRDLVLTLLFLGATAFLARLDSRKHVQEDET